MAGASQSQPSALHGVLLIVAAVAIFAVMDTIAKYLARSYPVSGVVWVMLLGWLVFGDFPDGLVAARHGYHRRRRHLPRRPAAAHDPPRLI